MSIPIDIDPEEEAASYDRWFRAKVAASLANPGVITPHHEVMAMMDAIIHEAEQCPRMKQAQKIHMSE